MFGKAKKLAENKEADRLELRNKQLEYHLAKAEGRKDDASDLLKELASEVDDGGWLKVQVAEDVLGITSEDVYTNFYYEDNLGVFDAMEYGYQMLPYVEQSSSLFRLEDSKIHGSYEECTFELDPKKVDAYNRYKQDLEAAYATKILQAVQRKLAA